MEGLASEPLHWAALAFGAFALVLLVAPAALVAKGRPWGSVAGLWIAGWGFLLIALGTRFATEGWGSWVVPGVIVTTAGHLIQSRAAKKGGPR